MADRSCPSPRAGDVPVVHVGSLSKVLAPGLRLGYATGPAGLLARMAADRQRDVPLEHAVEILLREGDLGRHARKTRRIYRARRDRLADLLRDALSDRLTLDVPAGELALWARLGPGLDAKRWSEAARRLGLAVTPGSAHCLNVATAAQAFRLGFADLCDDDLHKAVALLAQACTTR